MGGHLKFIFFLIYTEELSQIGLRPPGKYKYYFDPLPPPLPSEKILDPRMFIFFSALFFDLTKSFLSASLNFEAEHNKMIIIPEKIILFLFQA